ncbi:hypothetical protein BH20ACT5_BH20ACT5_21060 [soil metagenome]
MTTYTVHAELCRSLRAEPTHPTWGQRAATWPVAAGTCHAVAAGQARSACGRLSTPWTQVAPDWATHDAGPQRRLLCRKCRAALLAEAS